MKTYMFLNRSHASETFRKYIGTSPSLDLRKFDQELEFGEEDVYFEFSEYMKHKGYTRIPWDNNHHSNNIRFGVDLSPSTNTHKFGIDSELKEYYGESSNPVIMRDKWKLYKRQTELGLPVIPSALLLSEKSIRDFFSSLEPTDSIFIKPRMGMGSRSDFNIGYKSYSTADELIAEINSSSDTGKKFWETQAELIVKGDHMMMMKHISGKMIRFHLNIYADGTLQYVCKTTVNNDTSVEYSMNPFKQYNFLTVPASDKDVNSCINAFKTIMYDQKDPFGCNFEFIITDDGTPYMIDGSYVVPFGLTALEPDSYKKVVDAIESKVYPTVLDRQGRHIRAVVTGATPSVVPMIELTLRKIRIMENVVMNWYGDYLKISFNMNLHVYDSKKNDIRQLIADRLNVDIENVDMS